MVKEMLSESDGSWSAMRVIALITVLLSGAIAIIGIFKGADLQNLSILCSTFLGFGIGGKVIQKKSEVKLEIEEIKSKI